MAPGPDPRVLSSLGQGCDEPSVRRTSLGLCQSEPLPRPSFSLLVRGPVDPMRSGIPCLSQSCKLSSASTQLLAAQPIKHLSTRLSPEISEPAGSTRSSLPRGSPTGSFVARHRSQPGGGRRSPHDHGVSHSCALGGCGSVVG